MLQSFMSFENGRNQWKVEFFDFFLLEIMKNGYFRHRQCGNRMDIKNTKKYKGRPKQRKIKKGFQKRCNLV
jgi:hypothetical protein